MVNTKEAPSLRPGEKYELILNTDRAVGLDISKIFYGGDYGGDLLIVTTILEGE